MPGKHIVTTHSGKVDERAWCAECGWANSNYKNALATGKRHAESTGHEVHCEQGISIVYNRKGG
jgi:hypothetical protein